MDSLTRRPRGPPAAGRRAHLRGEDRPRRARARLVAAGRRRAPPRAGGRRLDDLPRQAPQGPPHRGASRRRTARSVPSAGDGPVELLVVQPEGKQADGRGGVGHRGPLAPRRAAPVVSARPATASGPVTARALALDALDRIDPGGAYANLLLPELLDRTGLAPRDRHFATELVYGTTRMRRACDLLVDRFLTRTVEPRVRNALRLGAYQLHHLRHGAPRRGGRDRAGGPAAGARVWSTPCCAGWPTTRSPGPTTPPASATRTGSLDRLTDDLGADDALAALAVMNTAPPVTEREDGYVQDLASQWVAAAVGAGPEQRVADLCAAPGGKALALAATGAAVVAARPPPGPGRASSPPTPGAARRCRSWWPTAPCPPFAPRSFDHVLVDAPVLGARRAPPPPGRPLADRCRRGGAAWPGGPALPGRGGPDPGPPRGPARVLGVHPHRGRGPRRRRPPRLPPPGAHARIRRSRRRGGR